MSKSMDCPRCGRSSKKHSVRVRKVLHLDGYLENITLIYYCPMHKYFVRPSNLVDKGERYSKDLIKTASKLMNQYTIGETQEMLRKRCGIRIPYTTVAMWRNK